MGGSAGAAAGEGRAGNPVARDPRRPWRPAGSTGGACARVPACAVSRSMEPTGWATQIELIRHGDLIAGCVRTRARADERSCPGGWW